MSDYQNEIVKKTLEVTKTIQTRLSYKEAIEQLEWMQEHLKEVQQNVIRSHAMRTREDILDILD